MGYCESKVVEPETYFHIIQTRDIDEAFNEKIMISDTIIKSDIKKKEEIVEEMEETIEKELIEEQMEEPVEMKESEQLKEPVEMKESEKMEETEDMDRTEELKEIKNIHIGIENLKIKKPLIETFTLIEKIKIKEKLDFVFICKELEKLYKDICNSMNHEYLKSIFKKNEELFTEFIRRINSINSFYSYDILSFNNGDNIVDRNFDELMYENGLINGYKAVKVSADGNCFYRTLSLLLFGTEDLFNVIKICTIFTALKYEGIIDNFLKSNNQNDEFYQLINLTTRTNEWAEIFNIVSAAYLIKNGITIFGSEERRNFILCYFIIK